MAEIFIGNVKGPQGDTGATGATGAQGEAATIAVGSVTTVPYGQNARVTNSGTAEEAVFDFVIPQGRPGEQTTKLDNLTIDAITEPSTAFPTPAVGDSGSTLFGKISKWFSDMTALVATKFNAANVVNNLTTSSSGYALDARQGKQLSEDGNWRFVGNMSSSNSFAMDLPSNWREIYVDVLLENNKSYCIPIMAIHRDNINDALAFRGGYGGTESGHVVVQVTAAQTKLLFAFRNGNDVKSTTIARVYYKPGYVFINT